jgi:P pilus assembly chaperone PapD
MRARGIMTPRLWRAVLALLLVALAAAGLTFVPSRTLPHAQVEVTGAQSLVCPSHDPAVLTTTVSAADTADVAGRAIQATASTPVPTTGVKGTAQPHVISGTQAIGGFSSATAASGPLKGLWLASCSPPSVEQAFVGLVADAAHSVSLLITNPDPTQATVDITFYGPKGRLDVQGSRGLTVLGNSTRQVPLAPLVSGEGTLTAVVTASQGRASTYARVTGTAGNEWVSPSAPAATSATIAGIPGGAGSRSLVVTNTSDRRTTAKVEVLSESSTFVAAGADAVAVDPGATVTVPLETALAGEVSGVRVTATQPVVAAAWSTDAGGDMAVSPARPAFQGLSVVPIVPGSVLVASNPGSAAASLRVTLRNGASLVDTATVTVSPGTSVQVPMTTGTSAELATDSPDLRLTTVVTSLGSMTGLGVAAWGPGGPGEVKVSPTLDPNLA